jgi:hypothetical protein
MSEYTSGEIINMFKNLKENEGLKITFGIPSNTPQIISFDKKDMELNSAGLIGIKRPIDILAVTNKKYGTYNISTRAITDVDILDEPDFILVNTSVFGE